MVHDAIGAHARDELGISKFSARVRFRLRWHRLAASLWERPVPLLVTAMAPAAVLIPLVSGTSLLFLALPGALAARAGGAGVMTGAIRVTFWGALAMALAAGENQPNRNSSQQLRVFLYGNEHIAKSG